MTTPAFLSRHDMAKALALVGFVVLALSPSFVDYQQSPELRWQIGGYYLIAILLICVGMDGWMRQPNGS